MRRLAPLALAEGSASASTSLTAIRSSSGPGTGRVGSAAKDFSAPWVVNHLLVRPHAGEGVDDGYFADLDPDLRIEVAAHVWELGEYLRDLAAEGLWSPPAGIDGERLGHFPPCHLREQGMGRPWQELLHRTSGAALQTVGETTEEVEIYADGLVTRLADRVTRA